MLEMFFIIAFFSIIFGILLLPFIENPIYEPMSFEEEVKWLKYDMKLSDKDIANIMNCPIEEIEKV